jgi:hypothetical protein
MLSCLRPGLGLVCGLVLVTAAACGGNADDIQTADASIAPPDPDGGSMPSPDGDGDPEPDAPPTACPVIPAKRLTTAMGASSQAAIIWTGMNYLVVWGDGRAGGANQDIYGVMLTAEGERVGEDVLLADTPQVALSPEVAPFPSGGGFVLAFESCPQVTDDGCQGGSSVATVMLGADGKPMGAPTAAPTTISPPVPVQRRPYLATGNGKVYVAYRDQVAGPMGMRTVARVAMLDAAGAQMGEGVIADAASNGLYPNVAVGPDQVALIYARNKPKAEIVLALYDPALTFQREIIVRQGMDSEATNPVVQWNTNRWVTAWEDQRAGVEPLIFATVVDQAGQAQPAQEAYGENGNWPTIASGGMMTSLIGFYGYPGQRVFLARMEANGHLKPGQVVLDTGKFPSVAYNGSGGVRKMGEYAVVYENEALEEIMFARFECAD